MRIENLRILASYGIRNDLAWVLRDVLQNFYDGAKKEGYYNPFDAIQTIFHLKGDDSYFMVQAPTYFDSSYLFYLGATSKSGDNAQIGEKGEGIKVSTLLAMRDYGLSVKYGSSKNGNVGWSAEATWVDVQVGDVNDKELAFVMRDPSTYTEEKFSFAMFCGDEETIRAMKAMDFRSWFADDSNRLLKNKITNNIYKAAKGDAHLFLAGLDRGTDHRLSFTYRLDKKLKSDNDRDRKTLSTIAIQDAMEEILSKQDVPEEVYTKIMRSKVNELVQYYTYDPECEALHKNPKFKDYFLKVFGNELERFTYSTEKFTEMKEMQILDRLAVRQTDVSAIRDILKEWKIKPIEVLIDGIRQAQEVTLNNILQAKLDILGAIIEKSAIENKLPIKIFAPSKEESMIMGTYNEEYVRLNKCLFEPKTPLSKALAVYVHELAHVAGSDGTPQFSDKLTEYMGYMMGNGLSKDEQPKFLRTLMNYTERWNSYVV